MKIGDWLIGLLVCITLVSITPPGLHGISKILGSTETIVAFPSPHVVLTVDSQGNRHVWRTTEVFVDDDKKSAAAKYMTALFAGREVVALGSQTFDKNGFRVGKLLEFPNKPISMHLIEAGFGMRLLDAARSSAG